MKVEKKIKLVEFYQKSATIICIHKFARIPDLAISEQMRGSLLSARYSFLVEALT